MSKKQKRLLKKIILAAVLYIVVLLLPVEGYLELALFLVPYLIVGYDVLHSAVRNILNGQVFDENFLMAIATVGAFIIGEYPEAMAVMLLYQIGELFSSIAVGKSRKSIASLMDIKPDTATVIRDGEEIVVTPEEVAVGETIVIKPGEKIPLDAVITFGSTTVNTSALTGESMPVDKTVGDSVISACINGGGLIRAKTVSLYGDSTVAKILDLVENSATKKSRAEKFITRFARYYTPIVVISAAVLALIPPLFVGGWADWIERALIFLVVSCPCAVVISVPLTFFGGIGGASKKGILVKGANYLEALADVETMIFDKTGTLTKGEFAVTSVNPAEGVTADELLKNAAMAESYSVHPIARSIVESYGKEIDKNEVSSVTEIAGKGVKAVIGEDVIYLGNIKLMDFIGLKPDENSASGTIVYVAKNGSCIGNIVISDIIKEGAVEAHSRLKDIGVKNTVMLTGDGRGTAEAVGKTIGLDHIYAELLPEDKVRITEEWLDKKHSGKSLVFVGDGINDAPVLSRSDVGIAMGSLGSDAAIEAADIVIMDDNLEKIPLAIKIARKTMRIVKENIIFALGVKAIVLVMGALGDANMWIAVFGDVGVLVIAILNAVRSLKTE